MSYAEYMDAWVAHEAAGAPQEDYAEYLLDRLDFYDRLHGNPPRIRWSEKQRADDLEEKRQSKQIAYEAAARQGFPLGPLPKVI